VKYRLCWLVLAWLLSACTATGPAITPTSVAQVTQDQTLVPTPTSSLAPASPTPTTSPTIVQTPLSESLEPPHVEDGIIVEAADGLGVVGTFYAPAGTGSPWPGVILLHMLGSDRTAWDAFARQLSSAGYAAFAMDMRGHGDTGGARDFKQAADDLQRVWRYFTARSDVDAKRTAVVGASIGANMALITGALQPAIKTVVLLSPGLDYRGVTTAGAIVEYGDRSVLIIASMEDIYPADSSRQLEQLAKGESRLVMYEGAGHGTNMFGPEPQLADLIIAWLNAHVN
jgi:pimeloyl-ACP methyl ester carboxylesterase